MSNRYGGKCYKCEASVAPGEGRTWRFRGRWYVACKQCSGRREALVGASEVPPEVAVRAGKSVRKPKAKAVAAVAYRDQEVPVAGKCRTRRDWFARKLLGEGYHLEKADLWRFWTLSKPGEKLKYFLGEGGAVRKGVNKTRSSSSTDAVN